MKPAVRPARQQSRARVLQALRDAGPLGIAALSESTGLSAGAVRFHLAGLLRAGSVRQVDPQTHARPGRPALEYQATSVDAGDPAAAYRMLAEVLGRQLIMSGEPVAAYEAGRRWAASLPAARISARRPSELVSRLMRDGGFDPTVSADGRTVALNRCPFYELAAELPGVVCAVHRGLTVGALECAGLPARVRVEPVLDGSGPCLVHLDDAPEDPALCTTLLSDEEIVT